MRIAVLGRGPVRPDMPTVNARLMELRWTFESYGHEVETFLATWTSHLPELGELLEPRHLMLVPDIEKQHVAALSTIETLPLGASMLNAVRQYVLARAATAWVRLHDDYDYVVHGRTDLRLGLGPHLGEWFVDGAYATIHTQHENAFLNDQFGIAQPDVMARAWDCGTLPDVVRRLEAADKPETILQDNLDDQGIKVVARPLCLWELDHRRHSPPAP